MPLGDAQALAAVDGKRVGLLVWDWKQPEQTISNRPFFTKVLPARPAAPVTAQFAGIAPGSYRLTVRRTGFKHNDAHTRYLEMGSPASLTPEQLEELQGLARDVPEVERTVEIGARRPLQPARRDEHQRRGSGASRTHRGRRIALPRAPKRSSKVRERASRLLPGMLLRAIRSKLKHVWRKGGGLAAAP